MKPDFATNNLSKDQEEEEEAIQKRQSLLF